MIQTDVEKLLDRIDDLQALLVCYRVGKRPTEKLFDRLAKSAQNEDQIKASLRKQ